MTMKIAENKKPLSFHIIECLSKDDIIVTWSFPTLNEEQRLSMHKKIFTFNEQGTVYYLRLKEWFYLKEFNISNKQSAVCIIALDYDFKKYEMLCNILVDKYLNTRSSVELTKVYLNFCTLPSFQENGILAANDFKKQSSATTYILKDMIKAFGPEIIFIYTALLFKKRIIVYHSNLKLLQKGLLCISKLMPFRDPSDFLYPNIEDVTNLQGKTFFVAGTTAENPHLNFNYYDMFVNLLNFHITITSHAKDIFAMTKIQRDFTMFLIELTEKTDINDTHILTQIKTKTQELLDNLKSFATVVVVDKRVITMDCLREKKLNPKMENFLFNLAVAENIMML